MNNGTKLDREPRGEISWPDDAVMITAANAGEENRRNMQAVFRCVCRRCGRLLHADTRTVSRALEMPERMGRPIMFFCVECTVLHDPRSLDVFEDCREPVR